MLVALGASCDMGSAEGSGDETGTVGTITCEIAEWAYFDNGPAVLLRGGLGWFSHSSRPITKRELWARLTVASLSREVLNVVLPEDAEITGDQHAYQLFADLLRSSGRPVSETYLRSVPYLVTLSPRLHRIVST